MHQNYVDLYLKIAQRIKLDYAAHDIRESLDQTTRFIDELTFYIMHSVVSDVRFARIASKYLACFRDPHVRLHVNHEVSPYKYYDYGITLRHFGDALYVEESVNPQFQKGDIIFSVDYHSVAELSSINAPCLFAAEPERESWQEMVHYCEVASIERNGVLVENVKLNKALFPRAKKANKVISISDGIVLVVLHELKNECDIEKFVDDNAEKLRSAKGIVLDIRDCSGTCDLALIPLAPFVADSGMRISDFLEENCLVNYSKMNCELLEQSLAPAAGDPWVDDFLCEIKKNKGKGLTSFNCEVPDELRCPLTSQLDCGVVVLTDRRCSGSAETLAEFCKAASRCILVGRNSSGTLGTLFPLNVPLNECFSLEYPIACFTEDALKRHGSGVGSAVDIHVPWTPEHLRRDVDVDTAYSLLADWEHACPGK